MDGNNKAEFQFRLEQAKLWSDALCTGRLPRPLAWLSMTTSILRSLVYPLPSTTFSKQECIKILRPVLLSGLPASGIARTFPRALVHAPLKYQGLALPNLWIEQGVAHLHSAITHSQLPSITGQLLRASLEAYILDLGLPGNPLFHGSSPSASNTSSTTQ